MEIDFGKKPSALIPVVLSLVALVLVLVHFTVQFGPYAAETNHLYEKAVVHVWQFLMVAQLPVIAFFGFRWLRRAPWQAGTVLVVQGLAFAAAAVFPVLLFRW